MKTWREWNTSLEELIRRWDVHRDASFPPSIAGVNIDGVELVLIDAEIAMLIQSCLRHGKLSKGGAKELNRLMDELRSVMSRMPESAKPYFNEIVELGELAGRLCEV